MYDDRTATLDLPLPHPENPLNLDVVRLRTAFGMLDARLAAIAALLASDDLTLDTVLEIVAAIKTNRADITEIVADKVSTAAFTAALALKADAAATGAALAGKADAAATAASLALKAALEHEHAIEDIAGLALALAGKADAEDLALKADAAATSAALVLKTPIGSTRKTASFAATAGQRYRIDNSVAGIVATLPAAPAEDDWIAFTMGGGAQTWSVARNGNKIMGLAEDMTVDLFRGGFSLRYDGAINGWVIE